LRRRTRARSLASRLDAESLTAEREILDSLIQADTNRPVFSAIRSAFVEQFSLLYVLLRDKARNPLLEGTPAELVELDKDCTKLAGLLFSRSNVWAAKDWRKPPIVKFLLRCVERDKIGRPLTKLGIAAQAKELRLADSKRWTWPELATKFCDCGKTHSISCQDNLRREILHLEKLLERCGYPV